MALRRGALRAGESVLVLARRQRRVRRPDRQGGGATVIAVAAAKRNVTWPGVWAPDVVLDHRGLASLSAAVREQTGDRGVDVVFDTVGGPDAREPFRCLAWNGRYLVIGFASGEIPVIRSNQTILKSVSIVGVAYGMSAIADPAGNAEDFTQLFAWYRRGLVTPVIGHRFPLAEAADAVRVVLERRALGKVVIEIPA